MFAKRTYICMRGVFLQTMRVLIELLTKRKYTQLTTIQNPHCGFDILVSCGSTVVELNRLQR
jgi:hypothetical protein